MAWEKKCILVPTEQKLGWPINCSCLVCCTAWHVWVFSSGTVSTECTGTAELSDEPSCFPTSADTSHLQKTAAISLKSSGKDKEGTNRVADTGSVLRESTNYELWINLYYGILTCFQSTITLDSSLCFWGCKWLFCVYSKAPYYRAEPKGQCGSGVLLGEARGAGRKGSAMVAWRHCGGVCSSARSRPEDTAEARVGYSIQSPQGEMSGGAVSLVFPCRL